MISSERRLAAYSSGSPTARMAFQIAVVILDSSKCTTRPSRLTIRSIRIAPSSNVMAQKTYQHSPLGGEDQLASSGEYRAIIVITSEKGQHGSPKR